MQALLFQLPTYSTLYAALSSPAQLASRMLPEDGTLPPFCQPTPPTQHRQTNLHSSFRRTIPSKCPWYPPPPLTRDPAERSTRPPDGLHDLHVNCSEDAITTEHLRTTRTSKRLEQAHLAGRTSITHTLPQTSSDKLIMFNHLHGGVHVQTWAIALMNAWPRERIFGLCKIKDSSWAP